jgi:hypothetical protein
VEGAAFGSIMPRGSEVEQRERSCTCPCPADRGYGRAGLPRSGPLGRNALVRAGSAAHSVRSCLGPAGFLPIRRLNEILLLHGFASELRTRAELPVNADAPSYVLLIAG